MSEQGAGTPDIWCERGQLHLVVNCARGAGTPDIWCERGPDSEAVSQIIPGTQYLIHNGRFLIKYLVPGITDLTLLRYFSISILTRRLAAGYRACSIHKGS